MKKVKLLILFILISAFVNAKADPGIQFEKGSWASITAKAKSEKRLIFIDCYTAWCGPCKQLSAEIFPQREVGESFNENFINYKVDMEKGEGIELSKKFHVAAYPTLLWVDHKGNVVHRAVGFMKVEQLLSEAGLALNGGSQLRKIEQVYLKNKKDPNAVYGYLQSLKNTADSRAKEIAKQYFSMIPKERILEDDIFQLAGKYADDPFSPTVQYILINKAAFESKFKQGQVDVTLENIYARYTNTLLKAPQNGKPFDEPAFQRFQLFMEKENFRGREMLTHMTRLKVFQYQKNWRSYVEKVNSLVESGWVKNVPSGIFSQWYENILDSDCDDPVVLNSALSWVELSFKNDYTFNMAYLGKKLEAKVKLLERMPAVDGLEKARIEVALMKNLEYMQLDYNKKQAERMKMIQALTNKKPE